MNSVECEMNAHWDSDDWLRGVVALANSASGVLKIPLQGKREEREQLRDVNEALGNRILPSVMPGVKARIAGDRVEITVQIGRERPYFLVKEHEDNLEAWLYDAGEIRRASWNEIDDMIDRVDGEAYEGKRCLRQSLTFEHLRKGFSQWELPLGRPQMITLRLIDERGLFTNLAYMLSDQCVFLLDMVRVSGVNEVGLILERHLLTGSLLELTAPACQMLCHINHMREAARLKKAGEHPDFPVEVFLETLVHLYVYMDCNMSRRFVVRIYDDRLELCAVGGVASHVSYAEVLRGASVMRNPLLGKVLERMRLIDCMGARENMIRQVYGHSDQKPIIAWADHRIQITLPSLNSHYREGTLTVYEKRRVAVLAYLQRNGSVERKRAAELLQFPQVGAARLLSRMTADGYLVRTEERGNAKYMMSGRVYYPPLERVWNAAMRCACLSDDGWPGAAVATEVSASPY